MKERPKGNKDGEPTPTFRALVRDATIVLLDDPNGEIDGNEI